MLIIMSNPVQWCKWWDKTPTMLKCYPEEAIAQQAIVIISNNSSINNKCNMVIKFHQIKELIISNSSNQHGLQPNKTTEPVYKHLVFKNYHKNSKCNFLKRWWIVHVNSIRQKELISSLSWLHSLLSVLKKCIIKILIIHHSH